MMSRKISYLFLILILAISFWLMLSVSLQESATMDELAHIPAGYSYLRYLDYRLNPEHPPLVKVLAAVPLIFRNLNFPINQTTWTQNINGQWAVGNQFIYHSDNDADQIIFWARLGPIILTLLLMFLIYIWAKELLGERWALLPTLLFGLSPAVLTHGHYVTTDIGAALGVVSATYFFIKFLHKPTRWHLIFAGLAFGTAQLMKFSAVLLAPYFMILVLIWCLRQRNWLKYIFSLIAIFLVGYLLVYLVYFVFTLNYPVTKQVADTESILTSFKYRWLADFDIKMAGNALSRPLAHYLLGVLMALQRSASGNTAYFLGQVSSAGWWYYFPVVFLAKEPLPSLILIGLALIFGVWTILKPKTYNLKPFNDYLGTHFPEFSMLIFVVFYWVYSMNSSLNIGVRHLLPTMPFIYILTTAGLKNWVNSRRFASILKFCLILFFLFWFVLEMIWAYPFYLSYFNQAAGGIDKGYRIVTDSNYDWGQDLKRLATFMKEKDIKKIAVDYFGGGDVRYYLGDKAELWRSSRGNPKDIGIEWLAVSVNTLQGTGEYQWLPPQPDFKAGTSIFIFHL